MEEGDDNYKLSSLVRYLNFLKMEIILQANNTSTKLVNRGYIDMYWNLMKLDMQLHNHLFDHCKDVVQFLNYCNLIGIEIIFRKKRRLTKKGRLLTCLFLKSYFFAKSFF